MTQTGWIGEGPDGAQEMPVTKMLLAGSRGGGQPGATLAESMGRAAAAERREARAEAERAVDADAYAANLVIRGYMPGQLVGLSQQLADVEGELADERAKIERGARRHAFVMREHAAGRVGALAAQRMLDGEDFGDEGRAEQLARRADRLRARIQDAAAAAAPAEPRAPDMFEEAGRAAHEAFVEATRARMEAAQAGRPVPRAPRPFGSVSRGAAGTEHTGPDCEICAEARRLDASRASGDTPPGAGMPDAELAEYGRETGQPYRPYGAGMASR